MIRATDLTAGYDGKEVLHSLNITVEHSDFIGILGPNACGKSTLVKVLSGVLAPSSGSVEVGGLTPWRDDPARLAKIMAVVPQATRIPFAFTGREVVRFGRYAHVGRFSHLSEEDEAAVERALALTDTLELAERPITEVSGGERQRIILARAIAQDAPVLALDEATASMDAHRAIDAFDLLSELNDAGRTILAVLHDINLAALYCKRLIFMKNGKVAADGPVAEVFTKETIEAVYSTPVEVFTHPATSKPHAVFLPRREKNL